MRSMSATSARAPAARKRVRASDAATVMSGREAVVFCVANKTGGTVEALTQAEASERTGWTLCLTPNVGRDYPMNWDLKGKRARESNLRGRRENVFLPTKREMWPTFLFVYVSMLSLVQSSFSNPKREIHLSAWRLPSGLFCLYAEIFKVRPNELDSTEV